MSVCLTMIVKNEAPVIRRCLESLRGVVDRFCIVDTGSTDDTKNIIMATLAERPNPLVVKPGQGQLVSRPWVDFAHNRNEAIDLARKQGCDYLLMMDADHVWHGALPAELTADAYYVEHRYAGTRYGLACLMRADFPFHYEGVLHEYLTSIAPHTILPLAGPWVEVFHDGARARDPKTYAKDAEILQQALAREPTNARYAFYLAQSLRDAHQLAAALVAYKHRSMMDGWAEETWYSKLEYARLLERTSAPPSEIERAYLAAFNFRPSRAEPLVDLARWHRLNSEWALALMFARVAQAIPRPDDKLFVDDATYDWRALDELAIAAYYAGDHKSGFTAIARLLHEQKFPPHERQRIEANATCYR